MRLKLFVKYFLQKLLGFERYLYTFAKYKVRTLRHDKKENDFFRFMDLLPADGNGIIIDVGANLGVMTTHLSRRFPECVVLAIEPMEVNYRVLKKVIAKYQLRNVIPLKIALGTNSGEAAMVMPVHAHVKQHGLAHMEEVDHSVEGERQLVQVRRLDELEAVADKVIGIKIDAENFESKVIEGARSLLLKYYPLIYCELWDNDNRMATFELVMEMGYRVCCLNAGKVVDYEPTQHATQNFIFVPALE